MVYLFKHISYMSIYSRDMFVHTQAKSLLVFQPKAAILWECRLASADVSRLYWLRFSRPEPSIAWNTAQQQVLLILSVFCVYIFWIAGLQSCVAGYMCPPLWWSVLGTLPWGPGHSPGQDLLLRNLGVLQLELNRELMRIVFKKMMYPLVLNRTVLVMLDAQL